MFGLLDSVATFSAETERSKEGRNSSSPFCKHVLYQTVKKSEHVLNQFAMLQACMVNADTLVFVVAVSARGFEFGRSVGIR